MNDKSFSVFLGRQAANAKKKGLVALRDCCRGIRNNRLKLGTLNWASYCAGYRSFLREHHEISNGQRMMAFAQPRRGLIL